MAAAQNAITAPTAVCTAGTLYCYWCAAHCHLIAPQCSLSHSLHVACAVASELNHIKCLPGQPCSRYCVLQRSSVVAFLREGVCRTARVATCKSAIARSSLRSISSLAVPSECRRDRSASSSACRWMRTSAGWAGPWLPCAVAANHSLRGVLGTIGNLIRTIAIIGTTVRIISTTIGTSSALLPVSV